MKTHIIIGAGASGCFAAANIPSGLRKVIILEQANQPLQKVRISGGGRCNVTHACFDPNELVTNYPRGSKELKSVFHKFQPGDTMEWFANHGVELKIEEDNRIFPVTNQSESIIQALLMTIKDNLIPIHIHTTVTKIGWKNNQFHLQTNQGDFLCDTLQIATGSSPKMWEMIRLLGHQIVPPVPSLFTFHCKDPLLKDLQGTSFPNVELRIPALQLDQQGPMLITHWGFSGPAILKLSAWGARELANCNYQFDLNINWLGTFKEDNMEWVENVRKDFPKKTILNQRPDTLTKKFWQQLITQLQIPLDKTWAQLSKQEMLLLIDSLTNYPVKITGKSTYKEEFVTAGGVELKEIDFRTMQSKWNPNLFFSGEILNIDAITGGFNFQACWSEGFIIAQQLNQNNL